MLFIICYRVIFAIRLYILQYLTVKDLWFILQRKLLVDNTCGLLGFFCHFWHHCVIS